MAMQLTPTEQRMYDMLQDCRSCTVQGLLECLNGNSGTAHAVHSQLYLLRKKLRKTDKRLLRDGDVYMLVTIGASTESKTSW